MSARDGAASTARPVCDFDVVTVLSGGVRYYKAKCSEQHLLGPARGTLRETRADFALHQQAKRIPLEDIFDRTERPAIDTWLDELSTV